MDLNLRSLLFACGVVRCKQQLSYFPRACRKSGSHPILFFPSSDFVHHGNGIGEFRLCLDSSFQIESIIHKRLPELSQNIFSRKFGSFAQFNILPQAASLFIEKGLLLVPRSSIQWRNSVCVVPKQHGDELLEPGGNGASEGHHKVTPRGTATSTHHARHTIITRNRSVERQVVVDILWSEYQAIVHMFELCGR